MAGNILPLKLHSTFEQKISNFPDDLYNFNDGDNLTKLMKILLGNSGTGQLNNLQVAARIGQQNIEFSNLDNILGQILDVKRTSPDIYSFATNPFIDQLTDTQWQEVIHKDASYRERLLGAAEAFQNGAVLWAIVSLCESLTGVRFYVVESWRTPGYSPRSATINPGQEVVLIPIIDKSGFFTWDQSKVYYILSVIKKILPSNFIITFASPLQNMQQVTLSNVSTAATNSEYFHLSAVVNSNQINTPATIMPGAESRYWVKNNSNNVAPFFAHLQTQEALIDLTGNIVNVTSTDANGNGPATNSVAPPSLQVTSTIYGSQ